MLKHFLSALLFISIIASAKSPTPKLIVFISIDQMRPDYFERYGHLFTGGLKRLYSQGIVYENADLNFAASETGPGHAALGTGCYPGKSGILGNEWLDPITFKSVYCVEDASAGSVDGEGGGFSPHNLVVPAIGDWLKSHSYGSKVISVSSKDRAAILMGGKKPDFAFWYSRNTGTMVTSDYYIHSMPAWAKEFNASGWIDKNVPDAWTKSLPESEYEKIGPDDFIAEPQSRGNSSFPHPINPKKRSEEMMGTPYGDFFVIDFSLAAVTGEKLGQRGVVDVLCVSLSNCDYVGHSYGPDSHEMLDLLVNVDKGLGKIFDGLDKQVGINNYIVALSADHAVCPLPEFTAQFRNIPAKRYDYTTDLKQKIDAFSSVLKKELSTSEDVIIKNSFLNYSAGAMAGWDSVKLEQRVKSGFLNIDAIADIYFRRDMIGTEPSDKPFITKYRNSYFVPRGEDYQYRIRENCIISSRSSGTTHGSPYSYDTHVPLIFWWSEAKPQKISREVHSADAAPTLAKFAGFSFPKNLDGIPLKEVAR